MVDAMLVTVHGFWSSPAAWDRLRAVWQSDDELTSMRIHGFGYLWVPKTYATRRYS
jgi:hypothetical protein